jgi:hypothetical protein
MPLPRAPAQFESLAPRVTGEMSLMMAGLAALANADGTANRADGTTRIVAPSETRLPRLCRLVAATNHRVRGFP